MNTNLTQQEIEEDRKGKKRLIFYSALCLLYLLGGFYGGTVYYKHKHTQRIYQEGYDRAIKDIKDRLKENDRKKSQPTTLM